MKTSSELCDFIASNLEIDEEVKTFESKIIASHVLGIDFSELIVEYSVELTKRQEVELGEIIRKRNTLMPLAYVINSVAFRDLDLFVDQRVLIPRPETELLVEIALTEMKSSLNPKVLDVGTGSGAIALSIAHEKKDAVVTGVDISEEALEVARLNMSAVGSSASRVKFFRSDLLNEISQGEKFDYIISNPPYISKDEKLDPSVVDFEPSLALFSEDEGLAHIARIIEQSKSHLKSDGKLFFEIGETQAQKLREIAGANAYKAEITQDFNSRDRFAILTPNF